MLSHNRDNRWNEWIAGQLGARLGCSVKSVKSSWLVASCSGALLVLSPMEGVSAELAESATSEANRENEAHTEGGANKVSKESGQAKSSSSSWRWHGKVQGA